MKKLVLLMTLSALAAPWGAAHAKPAPKTKKSKKAVPAINWAPSYFAAQQAAKRTGKPLFIDFYTDWCGPCKWLEQNTYKDPKFIAYTRGWIMVKINPEKSELGRQLAQKYSVSGFPTLIFTDDSGQKLGEVVGARPAHLVIPPMKKAARNAGGTYI